MNHSDDKIQIKPRSLYCQTNCLLLSSKYWQRKIPLLTFLWSCVDHEQTQLITDSFLTMDSKMSEPFDTFNCNFLVSRPSVSSILSILATLNSKMVSLTLLRHNLLQVLIRFYQPTNAFYVVVCDSHGNQSFLSRWDIACESCVFHSVMNYDQLPG